MTVLRRRLDTGVTVLAFAERIPALLQALPEAGLEGAVRLIFRSNIPSAVLDLEALVAADRPHFVCEGRLVEREIFSRQFSNTGCSAMANFEHSWGSWVLSVGRDMHGLISLDFRPVASRLEAVPSFVATHFIPVAKAAGAREVAENCCRLEGDVRLEAWTSRPQRLWLKQQVRRDSGILRDIVESAFSELAQARRIVVSMKSWISQFRALLDGGVIAAVKDLPYSASFEAEPSDKQSNVELAKLSALAGHLDSEMHRSGGMLEVLIIERQAGLPQSLAGVDLRWERGQSEVVWDAIAKRSGSLDKAWRVVEEHLNFGEDEGD